MRPSLIATSLLLPFLAASSAIPVPANSTSIALSTSVPTNTTLTSHGDDDDDDDHLVGRPPIICHISDKSPDNPDVMQALTVLRDNPITFCRQSIFGDKCEVFASYGGAYISFCAPWKTKVWCSEIADRVVRIRNECNEKGRVGGLAVLGDGEVFVTGKGEVDRLFRVTRV